jgi:hypothetical protein
MNGGDGTFNGTAHKDAAGYAGAFGMLLGASGLFGSMRVILNKIFGVRASEHIVVNKLHDFGMVLLVLIFFLIAMMISPALELMNDFADRITWLNFLRFNAILQGIFSAFSFLLAFLAAFAMYALVPSEKITRPATIASAACAAVLGDCQAAFQLLRDPFGDIGKNLWRLHFHRRGRVVDLLCGAGVHHWRGNRAVVQRAQLALSLVIFFVDLANHHF